jgi:hypothetical protein
VQDGSSGHRYVVYWAGAFFLGGFTVGVIVKLLLGSME